MPLLFFKDFTELSTLNSGWVSTISVYIPDVRFLVLVLTHPVKNNKTYNKIKLKLFIKKQDKIK